MSRYLIPLVIFGVLIVFLAMGLNRDPNMVPSPLINEPAPAFQLPQLQDPKKSFSAQEMRGKVWLLNVWASWCGPCREEHPVLLQLSQSGVVPVYGLNYKNDRKEALAWLSEVGNPYVVVASDIDGRVGIEYGVYGVPETYLIDRDGVIRFKQIGIMTPDIVKDTIIPMVKDLSK